MRRAVTEEFFFRRLRNGQVGGQDPGMTSKFASFSRLFSSVQVQRALLVATAALGLGLGACDSKSIGDEEQCQAGDTKDVDCNTCTCIDGAWSCTEKACAPYEPCADKVCGDTCQVCDPNEPDCVETQEIKACNAEGACVSEVPNLCEGAYEPCAGKTCGDACTQCAPDDADCFETQELKVCDPNGVCVSDTGDVCGGEEPYEPCAGKSCGDACTQCAPDDDDCFETEELKVCDPNGVCVSNTGDVCEAAYDPCEDKACGDECKLCAPDDDDCAEDQVVKACNPEGQCVPIADGLCEGFYDPCADKVCGDECKLCAPDDPDCIESQELKACDTGGKCVSDVGDLCL